jgi:hypothetical protein
MNKKLNIPVMKNDAAYEKPLPIKIVHLGTLPEIKRNSDAFAVDWQLEGAGNWPKDNSSGRSQNIARSPTNGRKH